MTTKTRFLDPEEQVGISVKSSFPKHLIVVLTWILHDTQRELQSKPDSYRESATETSMRSNVLTLELPGH